LDVIEQFQTFTLLIESLGAYMRKSNVVSLFIGILGVIALAACSPTTPLPTATQPQATTVPTATKPQATTVALPVLSEDYLGGGLLYDHWMEALGVDVPKADPVLWKTQTINTRTGANAWRCKECHGWDYKGVEGAYGSGSHKTGFKGVMNAASMSEEDLLAWLDGTKNSNHDFSPFLKKTQLKMLVSFLKKGVSDTAKYINADKTLKGADAVRGKKLFTGLCQVCHGEDGKLLNFGNESKPEFVGTVAKDNPWEFWHKASFGQPSTLMPSVLKNDWPSQDILDVLAYAQTLPTK